jgi:chromosomal replication initiator protein
MIITHEILIEKLQNHLSEPNLLIFKNSVEVSHASNQLTLTVTNDYIKRWLETKCLAIIESFTNDPVVIHIQESDTISHEPPLFEETPIQSSSKFNALFTFDQFIIGNNNRFAYAAAEAVSKRPANAYNPLFIYGSAGVGKTHLLHAIANELSKTSLRISIVTSEKFTNDLINSLKNRATSEFKNRYRSIDVLLIDDIQFIAGKESTQEEFFHTFNELHGQNKQIVITSDCPPNDIPTLQDRLKTRFSWGLTADIQPPEFETRIAILKTKLEHTDTNIDDDVLSYVATQFPNNVRELEGALNRITAFSNLMNTPIDVQSASKIVKDLIRENHSKKPLTIPQIKRSVAAKMNVSIDDLASKSRTRDVAMARQVAMYLCREVTNVSLLKIGEHFGNRDHSTVMHAIDKIKQLLLTDTTIQSIVDTLRTEVQMDC